MFSIQFIKFPFSLVTNKMQNLQSAPCTGCFNIWLSGWFEVNILSCLSFCWRSSTLYTEPTLEATTQPKRPKPQENFVVVMEGTLMSKRGIQVSAEKKKG